MLVCGRPWGVGLPPWVGEGLLVHPRSGPRPHALGLGLGFMLSWGFTGDGDDPKIGSSPKPKKGLESRHESEFWPHQLPAVEAQGGSHSASEWLCVKDGCDRPPAAGSLCRD